MSLPHPFNLDGRVAVVTGAASGLGIEFSEAMAEAGADVVCSDVNEGACEETAERVRGLGRDALAVRCDVSKEDDVKAMVERAVERFGGVDVLFNNAGIADAAPVHEYPTENWHQVIDVDLHGVYYCARECLKVMVGQGSGKIINVASIWGLAGASSVFPIPAYNAAKGAVVNLTRSLAVEFAARGVRVNAVAPSLTSTDATADISAEDVAEFLRRIPMRRAAEPAEVADVIAFLAGPDARFITGVVLPIDGGLRASSGQPPHR
jgi:meso-butanediol dehydrogenase/(S,S)-butanediol dehydrogenase/diacetyl reductase